MSEIYRASTIKRDRRSKARMEQLDEQIIGVLSQDHHPIGSPCFLPYD